MKPYFLLFFLIIVAFPAPAMAYIDPGSGSMLLQLILGGVAGLFVIFKLYWHQFLTVLGLRKKTEVPEKKSEPK